MPTNKTKVRPYMPAGIYAKAYPKGNAAPRVRGAKAQIHTARVHKYYATKLIAYKWCFNHL